LLTRDSFTRISTLEPNVDLFNNNTNSSLGWWDQVTQGDIGNCYLIASLNSVSRDPNLIKSKFVSETLNEVGLYYLQFYIRGKPWVLSIDDQVLFDLNNQKLTFA